VLMDLTGVASEVEVVLSGEDFKEGFCLRVGESRVGERSKVREDCLEQLFGVRSSSSFSRKCIFNLEY